MRVSRPSLNLTIVGMLVVAAGCGWGLGRRGEKEPSGGSGAGNGANASHGSGNSSNNEPLVLLNEGKPDTSPPRKIAGVDTSKLSERELADWWELSTSLYAPCSSEAVPVATCVEEHRQCAACTPMAQLIADQIHAGMAKGNVKGAASARFSQDNVVEVPLRDSPFIGSPDAPVTIVVFSDFQCPACKATLPVLEKKIEERPKDLKMVHKFYPLPRHPRGKPAAYAAAAALKQGKYWPMERTLFEHQDTLEDSDLDGFAKAVGLDMARYKKDSQSAETKSLIDRDIADGEKAGLTHTPYVLVNGRLFDVEYFHYDTDLDRWIDTELYLLHAPKPVPTTQTAASASATTATTAAPPTSASASAAASAPPATSTSAAKKEKAPKK